MLALAPDMAGRVQPAAFGDVDVPQLAGQPEVCLEHLRRLPPVGAGWFRQIDDSSGGVVEPDLEAMLPGEFANRLMQPEMGRMAVLAPGVVGDDILAASQGAVERGGEPVPGFGLGYPIRGTVGAREEGVGVGDGVIGAGV